MFIKKKRFESINNEIELLKEQLLKEQVLNYRNKCSLVQTLKVAQKVNTNDNLKEVISWLEDVLSCYNKDVTKSYINAYRKSIEDIVKETLKEFIW